MGTFDPLAPKASTTKKSVFDPLASAVKKTVVSTPSQTAVPYIAGKEPGQEFLIKKDTGTISAVPAGFFDKPGFVSSTVNSLKQTVNGLADAASGFVSSLDSRKPVSERITSLLKLATSGFVALPPIAIPNALLQGVSDANLPDKSNKIAAAAASPLIVAKDVATGINAGFNFTFGKLHELGTHISESPSVAPEWKEAVVLGIDLVGMLAVGKVIHETIKVPGRVGEFKEGVSKINSVVDSAASILNVEPEKNIVGQTKKFTPEAIQKGYYEAARTAHPDKGGTPEAFQIVNTAKTVLDDYNSLTTKEFNAKYDRALDSAGQITKFLGENPDVPVDVPNETVPVKSEKGAKTKAVEPISRAYLSNEKNPGQTLMERMKSGKRNSTRFQTGIDSKTASSINIGDPSAPAIGSVYEVDGQLFVVRDVDLVHSDVIGYRIPLDGSPSVLLDTVKPESLLPVQADIASIKQALQASQVPTGTSRSSQFVTSEQAQKNINKYLRPDEDLPINFVEKITTPDGSVAFGSYAGGVISLINNPHETTVDHEAVHWYLDQNYEEGEKQVVLDEARKQMGEEGVSDVSAEEWVADRFVAFVRGRRGVTGKVRAFFERALALARRIFKRVNPDKVVQLFEDITNKKRSANPPVKQRVSEEYYQEPEKLTSKLFTLPEFSGRVTVSRQFISDMMKSDKANLKQADRLLLEDVLNTQFKDQEKVDIQAFKKAVHDELLYLKQNVLSDGSQQYENITLSSNLRGSVENYAEHIYSSPIQTSAGNVHFHDIMGAGKNNYFAHTRVEDMADGDTRRVIEVQSDLFQRGRLEESTKIQGKYFDKADQLAHEAEVAKLTPYEQSWWQRILREEIRSAAVDGKKSLLFPTGETAMKVEGLGQGENRWVNMTNDAPLENGDLELGLEIADENTAWVVTDVLGDGKFKAVSKAVFENYASSFREQGGKEMQPNDYSFIRESVRESFDISGKVDTANPIYKFYESDVAMYLGRLRRGNFEKKTDAQGVTWNATAITQEDLAPVLAYQKAEQIPEEDYQAWLEAGAIASPDANLAAQETVAAYQIEKELGFIPEPGEIPAGKAADLEYRRNLALETFEQADLEEQISKEMAIEQLNINSRFDDATMDDRYEKFVKVLKKRGWLKEWLLDPSIDADSVRSKMGDSFDTNFFENGLGLDENEALSQFQSRYGIEQDLLEQAKKKTAVELRAGAKKSAERYVRDASIKKANRVKSVVLKINSRPKSAVTITSDEMTLLQNRLRDMAKGSKMGFAEGKRFMKDELMTKWRQKEINDLELANQLTDYMSENLPIQQRGRLNKALMKVRGNVRLALDLMDQIDRIQESFEKRQAIGEFSEQLTRFKKGAKSVAYDYVNRIRDILYSYEVKKPTKATLRRLNALASFIEQSPDAYIPSDLVTRLKRLARTPLADMTTTEINELNATVAELIRLGQLKQELKNVYDERVWQKNVDELIAGTVSRDPQGEGTVKKGLDGALAISDNINAPARVFDAMDGDIVYQGPNVKTYKAIRNASQRAEIVSADILMGFLEGIKEVGVESLTEEQQRTIYFHSVNEQGNASSVAFTMEKLGIEELRPLTEQERQVLELAKETIGKQTDDFETTYQEKNNKPFVRVENYLPFKYADSNPTNLEQVVLDERMLRASVEPGSVKERISNVRRELRTDFLNIIAKTIESQSNYIYVEPAMMNATALVKSKEYREIAGQHNSHYWNEYLDVVARNGVSANALKDRFIDPSISGLRFNVTAAILGGRLTTVVLQPFNLFHAYGVMTQRYGALTSASLLKEAAKTFLPFSSYKEDVVSESPALTLRQGGDASIRDIQEGVGASSPDNKFFKARNSLIKFALKWMKEADVRTAAGINQSIYKILRSQGMSDVDARTESDFVTDLITSTSQIADKPLVYSKGEGVRMFTMFTSFAFNEWGIVSHDIVKTGLLKGDYQAKYRAAFALSMIFASKMTEQIVRNLIKNIGKDEKDKKELPSPLIMSLLSIVSLVPFFGPVIVSSINGYDPRLADSPIFSTINDVISGAQSATTGKKESTKLKGALRSVKGLSTVSGIPFLPLILDWMRSHLIE